MINKSIKKYIALISIFFIILFALSFLTSITKYFLSFYVAASVSIISFTLLSFVVAPKIISHLKKYITNSHLVYFIVITVGLLAIKLGMALSNYYVKNYL